MTFPSHNVTTVVTALYAKRFDTRPCSPTRVESCCPPPSSPQEEQSDTPLSKSTPTRRVVSTIENAAVCAALSAEPVRVSVEWYMYVAHSSPLQIRSHLTCQFFCRQLRSHLDNQVRRHLAVISTATLGHPHSHLRACSQVATMFAATSTIIFTAPCSKQDPSRG